jgi:hypothetical protein
MRDESKMSMINEDLIDFRGFSFFGESDMEKEVKKQLIKYTKLRNKLNKKLKKIQDEEGIIRNCHLRGIEPLSSPDSELSQETVIPSPPVYEDISSKTSNLQHFNYT